MINCRKVQSKTKLKENFLKIPLKEINISPKKYSSIIVNDIKLDFSISLLNSTELNITQTNSDNVNIKKEIKPINKYEKKESKNIIMKEKSEEIYKNNMKNMTKEEDKKVKRFTYRKPLYTGKGNSKVMLNKSFDKRKTTDLNNNCNNNKGRSTEFQRIKNTMRIVSAINKVKKIPSHSIDAKKEKNMIKKEKENSYEQFKVKQN